jgi:hypothetical protein
MRNVSEKCCRENENRHFMFNIFFPRKSCLLLDNVVKDFRTEQATDGNMAHSLAYWITKATNTHSEFVILIASTLQKLSQEHATVLRGTCIAYLVLYECTSDYYLHFLI